MKKRQTTNSELKKQQHLGGDEPVKGRLTGIAVCSDGKIVAANSALAKILQRTADGLINCHPGSLFATSAQDTTQHKLDVLLQQTSGHTTRIRTQLVRTDQTLIEVDASISRLTEDAAEYVVTLSPLAVFSDANSSLADSFLQRSHVLRMSVFGELVASLLHSLGQPITAATGARDLLLDANGKFFINDTNARAATILLESVDDLAGRFNTIRNFVRTRKPTIASVEVNAICADAIHLISHSAGHAALAIEFTAQPELTAMVDASLVRLVVVSLLHRSVLSCATDTGLNRRLHVRTLGQASSYVVIEISHSRDPTSPKQPSDEVMLEEQDAEENLILVTCRLVVEQNGGLLRVKTDCDIVQYQLILPT